MKIKTVYKIMFNLIPKEICGTRYWNTATFDNWWDKEDIINFK